MTLQEIFDTAATHLLKQGKRASQNGTCLYRGPDDTKCAVGCLIKDEFYRLGLEGKISRHPMVMDALVKSGVDFDQKFNGRHSVEDFLYDLQQVHDDTSPSNWREELDQVAADYGLNPDAVIA